MRILYLLFGLVLAVVALGAAILVGGGVISSVSTARSQDQSLEVLLEAAVAQGAPGTRIDLAETLPGDWDEVALFPAYSANVTARETLGFDFDLEATPIGANDGDFVVLLAKDHQVQAWFVVPWDRMDTTAFTKAVKLAREDATLPLILDSTGAKVLDLAGAGE